MTMAHTIRAGQCEGRPLDAASYETYDIAMADMTVSEARDHFSEVVERARRAASARRLRSCSGSLPSGSTSWSKRVRNACLAARVVSAGSRWACSAYAAIRARIVRSDGLSMELVAPPVTAAAVEVVPSSA